MLVERGLSPAPRLLPLERALSQLYSKEKELETMILRAREQINQSNIKRSALINERRNGALKELKELLLQLQELSEREATYRNHVGAPNSAFSRSREAMKAGTVIPLTFAIVRRDGDSAMEFSADEKTSVEPGDIVKVFRTDGSNAADHAVKAMQ